MQETKLIPVLQKRLSLEVYSWKDLYPALVSALSLEKYAMIIVLALVILLASLNIVSLLYLLITNKTREIVILKSMGLNQKSISISFIILGMSITLGASIIGIMLACLTSWLLNKFPMITLPDAYYVTYLPSEMDWQLIFIIVAIIFFLSFIISVLPAKKIKHIDIADVLKLN